MCKICGGHTFREPSGDDRCDDCRNRQEEDAMGPPEFVEGIRAYRWGRNKLAANPYFDGTVESELTPGFLLFNQGYDYAAQLDR